MWRKISLRHRLNLLFAALLLAWLIGDVARMLADAGPRARAESESMIKLMSKYVTTALANAQDSPEPMRELAAVVANLSNLRHTRLRLVAASDPFVASAFVAADAKSPA